MLHRIALALVSGGIGVPALPLVVRPVAWAAIRTGERELQARYASITPENLEALRRPCGELEAEKNGLGGTERGAERRAHSDALDARFRARLPRTLRGPDRPAERGREGSSGAVPQREAQDEGPLAILATARTGRTPRGKGRGRGPGAKGVEPDEDVYDLRP